MDNFSNCFFLSVNLIMLSHGAIAGWATTAMPILSSNDTPLESGPMPTEEISWIGSITAILLLKLHQYCKFIYFVFLFQIYCKF